MPPGGGKKSLSAGSLKTNIKVDRRNPGSRDVGAAKQLPLPTTPATFLQPGQSHHKQQQQRLSQNSDGSSRSSSPQSNNSCSSGGGGDPALACGVASEAPLTPDSLDGPLTGFNDPALSPAGHRGATVVAMGTKAIGDSNGRMCNGKAIWQETQQVR